MTRVILRCVVAAAVLSYVVSEQVPTWCGKPYEAGSPHITIPADAWFSYPTKSSSPLLNFQCSPVFRPYISSEDAAGSIILDAEIVYDVGQPFEGSVQNDTVLQVSVESGGKILASGNIRSGTKGNTLEFPLKLLGSAGTAPYNIVCTASLGSATYTSSTQMHYLPPNPSGGTVTKTDLRTGALLVKRKGEDTYEPILPFGFYASTSAFSSQAAVDEIKSKGYNVIHPVPPFDNDTIRAEVLDYLDNAGLYFVYDMRHDYKNHTSIREQVLEFKNRSSLLLWYTADEPDGTQDAHDAPGLAADLIHSIDPYHPVSLVLNCFDYYWKQYSARTDIILEDAYPINANLTWSVRGTECTMTYGDCGCDDCTDEGGLLDIGMRIDTFKDRARIEGRSRSLSVWGVLQAFGAELYWTDFPTGIQYVAECATSILHGATGFTAWIFPNTNDIYDSGGAFGKTLIDITPQILAPDATFAFSNNSAHTVEAGLWTSPSKRILMVTNVQGSTASIDLELPMAKYSHAGWEQIFESGSGASFEGAGAETAKVTLNGFGTVIYVSTWRVVGRCHTTERSLLIQPPCSNFIPTLEQPPARADA